MNNKNKKLEQLFLENNYCIILGLDDNKPCRYCGLTSKCRLEMDRANYQFYFRKGYDAGIKDCQTIEDKHMY